MLATIADIAREAGVSTATVDRVLNNREGVRHGTRSRVIAVATQLGYADVATKTASLLPGQTIEMDFILPGGSKTFMDMFAGHLLEQCELRHGDAAIRIHRFDGVDPGSLARMIERVAPSSQGLGLVAIDHPIVRETLRAFSARGTPVLTLLSDISGVPTAGYVGIDNRAAGRLAAYLIGRFLPRETREIALFTGSLSYRGHEEREMGFRHLIAEEFSHLEIVEYREVREDSIRAREETLQLLKTRPAIAGIYNIGGGLRGIAEAISDSGMSGKMILLGHELTNPIRRHLVDGTIFAVIDQNPRVEAREAIDRLRRVATGQDIRDAVSLRTQVIFRENIPDV